MRKTQTLQDTLERQRLKPGAPPVLAHAATLLRGKKITVSRVIAVHADPDVDVILYLNDEKQPMTAWLRPVGPDKFDVTYEPGFQADPSI